jgi:nucleoside-diphosphate-sugar epimerase
MKYTDEYWTDVDKVIRGIPNVECLNGKSVLITGATGMICSSVAEVLFRLNELGLAVKIYLAGRNKERVENRFAGFVEGKDYFFVEYDATESKLINASPDLIIHGASNANPKIYSKQPVETMLGNLIGLNSLFELAVKANSKRLLYISSSEVYGNKSDNRPYKEMDYGFVDILNPRACYPSAKRAAETLCVSYSVEYGIETVIVRPGHIYGPTITRDDSRASAQFTWDVIDGQDIVMKSAGTQVRSYCYTLDCASAILTVLINGENGNAYNISNKNSVVSIRDMAESLSECAGRKIIFENPSDAEIRSYNMMDNSSLNAEKLESLGWKGVFNLKDGVMSTIKTMKLE